VVYIFCERRLRNIEPRECDVWSCGYWIGNGGYCFGAKREVRISTRYVYAHTVLPENTLKNLMRRMKIARAGVALRIAVEHYLTCPIIVFGEEGRCRICGRKVESGDLCRRCVTRFKKKRRRKRRGKKESK